MLKLVEMWFQTQLYRCISHIFYVFCVTCTLSVGARVSLLSSLCYMCKFAVGNLQCK